LIPGVSPFVWDVFPPPLNSFFPSRLWRGFFRIVPEARDGSFFNGWPDSCHRVFLQDNRFGPSAGIQRGRSCPARGGFKGSGLRFCLPCPPEALYHLYVHLVEGFPCRPTRHRSYVTHRNYNCSPFGLKFSFPAGRFCGQITPMLS